MPVQQCRSILIPRLLRHIALHPPAERQWIRELEAWLRQVVEQHPTVRVLGMCFGAQVLTTGAAPPAPCRHPVQAAAADAAAAGGMGRGSGSSSKGQAIASLRLIQSHGDQVRGCPGSLSDKRSLVHSW